MTRKQASATWSAAALAAPEPGLLPVSLVFFSSGAAGLIFEVVWFHRCGLVFGNSVWAASIVLSSFMGGLALGNALVGWYGHRARRLLRAYAALEAVVAIAGIALTCALPALTPLVAPIARLASAHLWLVNPLRLVTAFAALMVPATAMGATLPVLVGALSRGRGGFGRVLGHLYGWNTLGAVVGAIGAEVVLIDRLGVTGSAWIAALLNLGVAAAAFALSQRSTESSDSPQRHSGSAVPADSRFTPRWRLLACAFLAGGALLCLEVVWFRFLSMYVLTTTLAVSLMLAVVLAAIGLGGLSASSWLTRGSTCCWMPADTSRSLGRTPKPLVIDES